MKIKGKQIIFYLVIFLFFIQPCFATTFDEAFNSAVKNDFIIKKTEYDALYYLDLQKSLNRHINISYDLKNLFENARPKIDYIFTDKFDLLNFTQIKKDASNFYYEANKALTLQEKRTLANDLAEVFFNYLLYKQQYEISLQNIRWGEEILKDSVILKDAGKVSLADTIVAKTALNEVIAKSKTILEQFKVSKNKFKELTGRDSEPELPVKCELLDQKYYIDEYMKLDPNIAYYTLTNKAITLESDYDEKTTLFSPGLYGEVQTSNDSTNNSTITTFTIGIEFTGLYTPNFPYIRESREKQILSNNEQLKQILRDDRLFIDKLYHDTLGFQENVKLLEENLKLTDDLIKRMENGYKVRYVNIFDLLKVKNDNINTRYSLTEASINLIKNTILLEKLVDKKLYAN